VKRVLLESLLVAALGGVFAFGANALSPHGLKLARDYFPGDTRSHSVPVSTNAVTNPTPVTTAHSHSVVDHLREKGLNAVDSQQAEQLFRDPRFEQNLIVFIDARKDEAYLGGHIPGAFQLDRFHPENYLGEVMPACLGAQQIVIYCNGGECEDSEFAAIMLRDSVRIPGEKLLVYAGGITEWKSKGLPIETGARRSGQISVPKQ
jgi:rhodanese-related sulfurtransferase